jgi:hypothetical protein
MNLIHISDFKFWLLACLQIVGFGVVCIKLYAKSYSSEKGKNLATKEDIGEITQIVESIKTSLAQKTEELKSDLSYKNEHLIHLRAAERAAIINYYKATWVLVLNFTKPDLIKYEIDNFDKDKDDISDLKTLRYISEAELILNKIKEDISNLKYLKDISESELMFFYYEPKLTSIMEKLNSSLSEFERALLRTINLLLQVFNEITVKTSSGQLTVEILLEAKIKRSEILAKWYIDRYNSLSFIRTFNEDLKKTLLERLMSLTS